MSKPIEEILTGKEAPVSDAPKADPPKEETPKVDTPPDPALAEKEPEIDQSPPNDGGVPDSGPDVSRQIAGLKAAQTAERKKRQESEERLTQQAKAWDEERAWYKQQFERFQQPVAPKQPDVPKPSLFEDPEGWEKHTVGGAVQSLEQKLQAQRFQFSEMLARRTYKEEFGEAEKWAEAQIRQNPNHVLRQVLATSDDPGESLVQEYRKNKLAAEMSDPAAYRQKVLEDMLADPEQKKAILERLGAEPLRPAPTQPAPTALPSNLAGARSVGGSKGPVWQGPTPLSEIIPSDTRKKA